MEQSTPKNGNIKTIIPQIIATFAVAFLHIPLLGMTMGYSAVFIAQMEDCNNGMQNCTDAIHVTETESSWIASTFIIFIPVGAITCSLILDSVGRVNIVALSTLPGVIGWTLIAVASDINLILVGRMLNGFSAAWCTCATSVYISEITSPNIRASMAAVTSLYVSFGIAVTYILGYLFHFRLIAWISIAISILGAVLAKLMPSSPIWLISRQRIGQAEKSLKWLNRYHSGSENEAKRQLEFLTKIHGSTGKESSVACCDGVSSKLKMILEPTVYKPMLILPILNIFTQFSGVYVIVFYAVTLFEAAGTNINPYLASIYFGSARFVGSIIAMGFMQRFGRRQMLITSGLIMAVSIAISGLYTKWIHEGTTTIMWVPVAMMNVYVLATMLGFLSIPLSIPSELFPTAVRGMAQSISLAILYALSFVSILSYYTLTEILGGSSGLQFFFATMSIGGVLYIYIFLPETHNKSLHDIGHYFKNNTIYLFYIHSTQKITESRVNII